MIQPVRRALTRIAGTKVFARAAAAIESRDRAAGLLRVLTYHRVIDPAKNPLAYPGVISAAPSQFAQQMEFIASTYHVVSIDEVRTAVREKNPLPARSVLITFDDAYCDFAENAWPVLRRMALPVVLFVPTAYPDRPEAAFWWDRLHRACLLTERTELKCAAGALKFATPADRSRSSQRLNEYVKSLAHEEAMALIEDICSRLAAAPAPGEVLGWTELRQLAREGVDLAPHTRTHPLMDRLSPELAEREAVESLRDLEREVGDCPPVFAYPGGGYNSAVVERMRSAGFELAFTTRHGANSLAAADPLRLARINVSCNNTVGVLRARLLACS